VYWIEKNCVLNWKIVYWIDDFEKLKKIVYWIDFEKIKKLCTELTVLQKILYWSHCMKHKNCIELTIVSVYFAILNDCTDYIKRLYRLICYIKRLYRLLFEKGGKGFYVPAARATHHAGAAISQKSAH